MGIDVGGGDLGTSWQRFTVGLLFRDGALYRGTDGLTGTAAAISMAQQHEIRWEASSTLRGAVLRSDVTAVAGQDVGIIFSNTQAKIGGTGERAIALFKDDIAGAGAVNWLTFTNARTNVPPRISTDGSDTNVPLDIQTKGQAITRFQSHAGSGENLRITPPVTAPVNYLTVTGAGAGSPPKFSVAGPDTNIDLWIGGKGTGVLRFGALTATADAPITGYVTIKLDNGATCKLASIA
jgi:hypothetical protein